MNEKYDDERDFRIAPSEDGKSAVITRYAGEKQTVIIPPCIDGMQITSIGDVAFAYCKSLTSVTIPLSVTSIGNSAFAECSSLTSIMVAAGNPNYSSEGGILYNKDKTVILAYPSASGNVIISEGVTSIGKRAFSWCKSLTSVTIPESVTSIGEEAFAVSKFSENRWLIQYGYMTDLKGHNRIDSISTKCDSSNITILNSVASIRNNAFFGWDGSQTINVEGHASEESADTAWGADWRGYCYAKINYMG
jgi:hypothetical protein